MLLPVGDNIERRTFPTFSCVLVFLNLFVFATQIRIFVHNPNDIGPTIHFIKTWGLVPADLVDGRYVGALTHMFLHGGIAHLLGNMFCLWAFACSLEAGVGAFYLGGFYLMWGVGGGLLHAWMNWGAPIPLVGASGAIAGLMGAYAVLYGADTKITTLFFLGFKPVILRVPASLYCLGWFALQVLSARYEEHNSGGIAWYAHIGGFALGAVTALLVKSELKWDLVSDRDGTLVFRERGVDPLAGKALVGGDYYQFAEHDVAGNGSGLPDDCPHCGEPLVESMRITPGVARCGNQDCARLVYAGAHCAQPAPVGARRRRY